MDHFPLGGSFDDNEDNRIALRMTNIATDTVFSNVEIPYLQEKTLQIRDGARVEFEAGVDYQFAADTTLDVGWSGHAADFQVVGTEDEPVTFHGSNHTPGYWGGILIQRNVLTTSSIRHAVIADAGGQDTEALRVSAKIDIRDVLLTENETGAFIDQQGLKSSSNNLSITKTEGYPLTLEPAAALSLPEGGDFTGNDTDRIVIVGGNIATVGTIPNPGIPYFVRAEVTTREGSDVTLTPGTTFIMGVDTSWDFGWSSATVKVTAVGTNEDPIVFVGDSESPGSWEGIRIGRNVSSDSAFRHVHISHGGGGEQANLWLLRTGFDITESVLTESATYGISTDGADPTDYAADNDLSGNALGAIGLR